MNRDHWFWKYAYENKGVYIQGGIATFMVNLFALVIGFFVMVVYDFEEAKLKAKQAIEIESRRDEALFNEFKARKGLEALEQEIKKLEKFLIQLK